MARPYLRDLRERVVAAVERDGMSRHQAAVHFGVAISTAIKWGQRLRRMGSAAPGQRGGHKPRAIAGAPRDGLIERCRGGDFTLRGRVCERADRGLKVDYRSVWAFVHAETLSYKKTALAREQDRPDGARRRAQGRQHQAQIDPARLVFIDETWTKANMAPLRGWSPCGTRLIGKAPYGHWHTMTFIAALRHDRITAPWLLDGPINRETFEVSVEKILVPTLKPGDLVIMDNLSSHKGRAVRQAIRQAGAKLFLLPKHSPDLNPIEQVFAKLKPLLRKAAAHTQEAVCAEVGRLLATFTPEEGKNYFRNSGYGST